MPRLFLILCCALLLPTLAWAESLRLEIGGVTDEVQKILETALVIPSALTEKGHLNQHWMKNYQRQLPDLVRLTLEPYGYFHSQTTSQVIEDPGGNYRLKVEVTQGDPLRITGLELKLSGPGAENPDLLRQLAAFPLNIGDVLRQDTYEQGKTALRQGALDLGYLEAEFDRHQIIVHREKRQVDILLQLDTGRRYSFGATTFIGQGSYPEIFLRRYLTYHEGENFSHDQLGQTQRQLVDADLFHRVNLRALTDKSRDGRVPIQIELSPAPRYQLRPGLGYGTDTGARISMRFRNLNLLDRGHEFLGDVLLAERKQSLLATYIIPDLDRADSQTLLRVGLDSENTDSYQSRKLFSEAEYQRSLGSGLVGSLFIRLFQESSRVSDDHTRAQMLLPGIRLIWRQVDNQLNPRRGLQTRLELVGAEKTFFSDTSLLQLSAQATERLPLPGEFSLLLRLQGGTTWQDDPLSELPASLRFFAGGDRSVRGYGYQALGPKDDLGKVVGGKHLLVANLELEKAINQDWGMALFYDVGNAFDSFAEYDLAQGAGFGIRRYTRIGPLRLDLARQLGTDKAKYRLHLSVGFGW